MSIRFTIPVRVTNPLNGSQGLTRRGMIARAVKRKRVREMARLCFFAAGGPGMAQERAAMNAGLAISMTRVSPRALDGHDGLHAALKPIADGICDGLGIRDNDPRLTWLPPSQRRGKVREHCVEVVIE